MLKNSHLRIAPFNHRTMIRFATLLSIALAATLAIIWERPHAALATRTWDGGGVTGNWSEAANWSGDAVPTSDDFVVFDGTSTKDATVDISVAITSFSINAGYTGTITIADGTVFTTFNNFGFTQAAGTLSVGNATVNPTMFIFNAGTFNGGSGSINVSNGFAVNGGTFNAPSGTLAVAGGFDHSGGVFNHNNGTVRVGNGGFRFTEQDTFNDLTIDAPNNINVSAPFGTTTFNVIGTLRMVAGTLFNGGMTLNLTGGLVFDPTYTSNGAGDLTLRLGSSTPRTITFPAGIQFFRLKNSSAGTLVNFSGTGQITFQSLTIEQGQIDQGGTPLTILQDLIQAGGTFNAGTVPMNIFGTNLTVSGGTFNGGTGNISSGLNFNLTGGTFNAPSGTLFLKTGFNHTAGVFNANGGTVAFTQGGCNPFTYLADETFNDLSFDRECTLGLSSARMIVLGTLTLTRGYLGNSSATIEARGDVIVQPTWGQEFGLGPGDVNFIFGGTANQTFTNNGAANFVGEWTLNKPSGIVNLASDLDLRNGASNAFRLTNGTFTTGSFVVKTGNRNKFRTNGYIIGNLERTFPSGQGPFLPFVFDVGTDSGYSPAEVTANVVNVETVLRVRAVESTHPAINPAIALGRYWTLTEFGDLTARLKFSYLDGDVNGNEINYKVDRIENGQVEILGPTVGFVNTTDNTATIPDVAAFSDWTLSTLALPLTISPSDVFADRLNSVDFSPTGGNQPYTYSIPINNSGASINSLTGLYRAGTTSNVNDTVRVTDGDGNIAEAVVRVVDPFVVANTNADGVGSLRRAIFNSEDTPGVQTITFNIPGTGPFTIVPVTGSPIPVIADPVIIDATTQPGYAGVPLVEIKRESFGNGIQIIRGPTTIRGLAITGFLSGITIRDGLIGPCDGNVIEANYLGVRPDGSINANTRGVELTDCANNTIGGTVPAKRNVIGGNSTGIDISLVGTGNTVIGNLLGVLPDMVTPVPNKQAIRLVAANVKIGGIQPGEGNVIAFGADTPTERGVGVAVLAGDRNPIRGNSILSNSGLGIDATDRNGPPPDGSYGVTPNDVCDTDIGGNGQQNFPVLTSAVQSDVDLTIQGTLNSAPGQIFDVDFYANDTGDPSGNGEGQFFLGSTQVTTDGSCNGTFTATLPPAARSGQVFSATATDANGNTSEFSAVIAGDIFDPRFAVVNTANSGTGSLRQAILNANSTAGVQTIRFRIPGSGPFVIRPLTELPELSDSVTIDGSTQPGFTGQPIIEIAGNSTLRFGLRSTSAGTTIKSLSITDFNSSGLTGTSSHAAIRVEAGGNVIQGNFLGLDPLGNPAPNLIGVFGLSSNNLIGGPLPTDGNIISGNNVIGLSINSNNNTVENNLIGVSPDGILRRQNGIGIAGGGNNNIFRSNIVSGNTQDGVLFSGSGNLFAGNHIGLNSQSSPMGNGGVGIRFTTGIFSGNTLTENKIFGNASLGIALSNSRVIGTSGPALPNDPQDGDNGANGLQNYPAINSAISTGGVTTVSGLLNSTPSSTFTLEFFSNPSCDASGSGEGETFLGSTTVTTDAGGLVGFTKQLSQVPNGRLISATATSANGSTSEFSRCRIVTPVNSISGRITDNGQPAIFTTVSLSGGVNTSTMTDFLGNYTFRELPSGLNYTVTPVSGNFSFTPASRTISNLSTDAVGQDFAASRSRFIVSGNISRTGDTGKGPLSGVTVTLDGSSTSSVQTDINGNYTFASVLGGTYTLSASKSNFFISPGSVILNVTADQTVNFAARSQLGSPLTGKIYFTREAENLFGMNADGSGLVTLVSPANVRSTISPDGRKLAFRRNDQAVATTAEDGSGLRIITSGTEPAFSPDGTKIALSKTVGTGQEIFTMNPDGTGQTRVTFLNDQQRSFASSPNWSPDGSRIAFAAGGNICTVELANGVVTTLATNGLFPDWSPNGSKIIFLRGNTLVSMNPDGSGQTLLIDNGAGQISKGVWAPDGTRILFSRQNRGIGRYEYVAADPDGTNQIVILSDNQVDQISQTPDWGIAPINATPVGTDVSVASGAVSITFPGVTVPGETSINPIPPQSAGTAPGGFVLGGIAYEISTTASFTQPVTVCFDVPVSEASTQTAFDALAILHSEGGLLVDRTVSRTFATRKICASVNSFSPFVLGSQVNPLLPSIHGLVVDSNGDPLVNVNIKLTGAEDRTAQTDSNGLFHFVNLTDGGNYNVRAKQIGYVFSEYGKDFIGISGVNTVIFTGTAGTFQIAGKVTNGSGHGVPGVLVGLTSDGTATTTTDAAGDYVFTGLPADGSYYIGPQIANSSPGQQTIEPLLSDAAGVDFVIDSPTAALVALSGRITTTDGQGIGRVWVVIENSSGERMTAVTSPFGFYRFDGLQVGETYILSVSSKRFQFQDPTRVITLNDELNDVDFIGSSP